MIAAHTPVTYVVDPKKRMEKEHLHGKEKDTPARVAQICADSRPFCTDAGGLFSRRPLCRAEDEMSQSCLHHMHPNPTKNQGSFIDCIFQLVEI